MKRLARPIAAAIALAAAGPGCAQPGRDVPLRNPELAATPAGRADLEYLSRCALDEGTTIVAEHAGRRWRFAGRFGLAPRWHEQAIGVAEQQAVSACMLALQNHRGVPVAVALHLLRDADIGAAASPDPGPGAHWRVREGRYFGNLFASPPRAYVCSPRWSAAEAASLRERQRLCALPVATGPDGRAHTRCDMVHVGECSDSALHQDGERYRSSMQVFLDAR